MFGHPLHPALVHFPLGLLLSATLADAACAAGLLDDTRFAALLMLAGLVFALLAMIAGLIDFARLPDAAEAMAFRHIGAVGTAWLLYAVALYLRREVFDGPAQIGWPSLALSGLGGAVLALGGWFGGELVYRYGAGRIAPRPD